MKDRKTGASMTKITSWLLIGLSIALIIFWAYLTFLKNQSDLSLLVIALCGFIIAGSTFLGSNRGKGKG